ncbi:Uncharacterised protein [Vibrio cholerae]|nr:Uncharacterised protein [Vibrio cholerae]
MGFTLDSKSNCSVSVMMSWLMSAIPHSPLLVLTFQNIQRETCPV